MRKKVLSVLVSLCMVVNLLPSIAFAVSDETGIGKNSDTKNAMEIVNQAENGGDIIEDTPFDNDSDNLIDYVSEPIPVTVEDEVVVRTFDISNGDIKIEDSTTEGETGGNINYQRWYY